METISEVKCKKLKGTLSMISNDDICEIESVTEKQSESELWHKARYARVTASKCHDVMMRMRSLEKDETKTSNNLVKRFLYSRNVSTKPMEMGKKWEKTAFYKYQQVMKKGKHVFVCLLFVCLFTYT